MAEIPDLGEHCALKNCNQLDFVPFRCDHCSSFFCRNHRLPDQHSCIVVRNKNNEIKGNNGEEEFKFLCSMSGCFQRERTRIQCLHCNHNFCMRHRICEEHECGGLKQSNLLEKQQIKLQIEKRNAKARQNKQQSAGRPQKGKILNAEQRARLDRVQIMKLKVKNPLKLDANEQHFLFANLPAENGENRQVVVVSRKWSILKAIWHIAGQLGLEYSDNLLAFKFQNSFETEAEEEDMKPLPLTENVAKFLPNESEIILRWKEE